MILPVLLKFTARSLLFGLLVVPLAVAAQTLPPTVGPGLYERDLEAISPQLQRDQSDEIAIPDIREQAIPEDAENARFVLRRIEIPGVSILTPEELGDFYRNRIGSEISLADIFAIAGAITARYQQRGYILGRAFVPPQQIENGVVTIQVYEGYIDRVLLSGDVLGREEMFERYSERLIEARPLTAAVLERYLLLASDLAGVHLTTVLRPSETNDDAAELILEIEQKPVEIVLGFNNRGTKFMGPASVSASATFNGLIRRYGRTRVSFAMTDYIAQREELRYLAVEHTETLNARGTELRVLASISRSEPGFTLAGMDVDTEAQNIGVEIRHPLTRGPDRSVYVLGGFYARNADINVGNEDFARDEIRALRAGIIAYLNDRYGGSNAAALQVTQGISVLGASSTGTVHAGDFPGDATFTRVNLEVVRRQRLADFAHVEVRGGAQWTEDDLVLTERFAAGGRGFGRAFDRAELTGDRGVGGSVELQISPSLRLPLIHSYQLYGFYDFARLWTNDSVRVGTLESAGGGLRLDVTETLSADFSIAKPLNATPLTQGDRGVRFFFDVVMHSEEY